MKLKQSLFNLGFVHLLLLNSPTAFSQVEDRSQSEEKPIVNTLEEFHEKALQITAMMNPGDVIRAGLFKALIGEEIIIVRAKGKIIRTFITSAARAEKCTPHGVFLGIERANPNHSSDIYHTEMDWALFMSENIAIHSTTEDHYAELGKPASAGCLRLLREDARELFHISTGKIATPVVGGTQDYVGTNQIGIYIVPQELNKSFWDSLPRNDQLEIIRLAKEDRLKIDASVKDFNKNGDRFDDEHEDTIQVPPVRTSR